MSEVEKEGRVWPPPPTGLPGEEAEPSPKPPHVTNRGLGRASLGLSGLGSLCALAHTLISAISPHDPVNILFKPDAQTEALFALQIGSVGLFFTGFVVGLVGRFSWEGKVGLCSAVIIPLLWLVVSLVDVPHGP